MNTPRRNDPCPCGSGKKFKRCCLEQTIINQRTDRTLDQTLRTAHQYHKAGHLSQAENLCLQVLRERPDNPDALHLLGELSRHKGKYADAVKYFQAAVAARPDFPEAWYHLGLVLDDLDNVDAAADCFREVLAHRPDSASAHFNLGYALVKQGRLEEAIASYHQALAVKPGYTEAYLNLGVAYFHQGRSEESAQCYRKALALQPDSPAVHSNILVKMLYVPVFSAAELFQEHRRYAQRFEAPLMANWPEHDNKPDPERRLKIGYVSTDFRRHSVAYFIGPTLANHDKSQVEVYAYYTGRQSDEVSARLQGYVEHWVPCAELSDLALAQRIRDEKIDILVDLSGHTPDNRLLTFARKPAPVQVTYLGYPATTGLAAMDYRLCSWETDPVDQECYHSERLYRLPTLWCYRPPESLVEPSTGKGETLTLGSMNNLSKLSEPTIAVWAKILQALPEASLVVTNLPTTAIGQVLRDRFARYGIHPSRLILHGKLPVARYREVLESIDIGLDPFPYNGTTTTCETLWMGVPVVSLVGESSVSRSGYALLKALELEELAAVNEEDYVRIVQELGQNKGRREKLRQGVREQFSSSGLRDEIGFTRTLEAAYRNMWQEWCNLPPE